MANPSVEDFLDTSNTVTTQRTYYTQLIEEAERNPGGLNAYPVVDVTGFSVLPPTACFAVQPEGGAGSAELRAIDPTGISIGQSVWIRAANSGAPVTVKDGVAGTGRILLSGARDVVLAAGDQWLQLILASASHWEEASRALPPLATAQEIMDGTVTDVRSLTPELLKNVLPQTATAQEMAAGTETALRSVSPALIRAAQYQAATSQEMAAGTETALRSVSPALVRDGQYQAATSQEVSDGTETALRSFSPKDLADSGAIHGAGGGLKYLGRADAIDNEIVFDLFDDYADLVVYFFPVSKGNENGSLNFSMRSEPGGGGSGIGSFTISPPQSGSNAFHYGFIRLSTDPAGPIYSASTIQYNDVPLIDSRRNTGGGSGVYIGRFTISSTQGSVTGSVAVFGSKA